MLKAANGGKAKFFVQFLKKWKARLLDDGDKKTLTPALFDLTATVHTLKEFNKADHPILLKVDPGMSKIGQN